MKQKIISHKGFIHHKKFLPLSRIREVIFGAEDGMVSTLGAITGIAVGSENIFLVILSGLVIIAVESFSMGIGSYLSLQSVKEIDKRMLEEEKYELKKFPESEKKELVGIYKKEGWSDGLAVKMAEEASHNKKLMFREMAYHELNILPKGQDNAWINGIYMFFAYIIGGLIPLSVYFILQMPVAIYISVIVTLICLFILGALTTILTKRIWWKVGLRMLVLAGLATFIGIVVGHLARSII